MLRVMPLVLVAIAAFAQTPPPTPEKPPAPASPKAPPEVEAALRARVTQFYQFEVEGKFYQALQLVADDTKDYFVSVNKSTTVSFQIGSIQFSDNFTKAEVVVTVHRIVPLEGFMGHPLFMRDPGHWKLERGEWCYYTIPRSGLDATPFRRILRPGTTLPTAMPPGAPSALPPAQDNLPKGLGLTADKPSVRLKSSGPSSEQVAISNPSPWPMALSLTDPKIAGLTVTLDRLALKPNEKAILSIQSSGGVQIPKAPFTISVKVQQTNQIIPIQVSFVN
jgi:hypothetical protein